MGCINSRPPIKNYEEELKIVSFELSLQYNRLSVVEIDRTFHRYSTNHRMSKIQLSRAFKKLHLPLNTFSTFYKKFSDKHSFSTQMLKCLGILLSGSSDQEKLKVLFECYDEDLSENLSEIEINRFLEDLTLISCEIIPNYALSLCSIDKALYNYIKQINDIRKSIVRQICTFLTEDKKSINLDDLTKAFSKDEGTGCILNPQKMRVYCAKVRSGIIKTAEYAMKEMDNQDKFEFLGLKEEKEFIRKITKRFSGNGISS